MELSYSVSDQVAHIVLNAPERLNALSAPMMDAFVESLARARREARAVLLRSEGRAFCAGVDLAGAEAAPGDGVDGGAILERHVNPMFQALYDIDIPVLGAVQGAAAGLGMGIALACDMVVAGESAFFLAPFVRIGLAPDGGIPALLARSIGKARTMRLLMLGEKLPARTALEWGLIGEVVEDEKVQTAALALATKLALGPTIALGGIRRLVWEAGEKDFPALLARERELQRTMPETLDCQEGNAAFLEKRPPRFVGR